MKQAMCKYFHRETLREVPRLERLPAQLSEFVQLYAKCHRYTGLLLAGGWTQIHVGVGLVDLVTG